MVEIEPVYELTVIIPAYNEQCRIEPVLRSYARYFKEHYRGRFQLERRRIDRENFGRI